MTLSGLLNYLRHRNHVGEGEWRDAELKAKQLERVARAAEAWTAIYREGYEPHLNEDGTIQGNWAWLDVGPDKKLLELCEALKAAEGLY